mgnify:FL=1
MSNRLWETFKELSSVYSPSFRERELCDILRERLKSLGVTYFTDNAGDYIGGNCGNLYGFLPGSLDGPPLLFSAHMDTVEPAKGKRAVLKEDGTILPEGGTILGADDIASITIILEAMARIKEENMPHRSVELLFPVAEELYGAGSAVFEYGMLQAKEAYVLDLCGSVGEAANAAPTIMTFEIKISGRASHAGFAPEDGINAVMVAARAVAGLPQGRPVPGLTFNIGRIAGGEADNIVPALCTVKGEIRSLNHGDVMTYWEHVTDVFRREAEAEGAGVELKNEIRIKAYETPLNSPVVRRFQRACESAGIPCNIHHTFGGSDQNNFALNGIEGLVIACSMHEAHSTREHSNLNELEDCVRLVMNLMTDREEDAE